jgi:hypothetical protein
VLSKLAGAEHASCRAGLVRRVQYGEGKTQPIDYGRADRDVHCGQAGARWILGAAMRIRISGDWGMST